MTDRIEAIREMLADNPKDVFLHYSLGMEYASEGRHDEAVEEFRQCVAMEEDYLAAYVEAGKSLRSAGRLDEARETLATALDRANALGEHHMADFIRQQLDALRGPSPD